MDKYFEKHILFSQSSHLLHLTFKNLPLICLTVAGAVHILEMVRSGERWVKMKFTEMLEYEIQIWCILSIETAYSANISICHTKLTQC